MLADPRESSRTHGPSTQDGYLGREPKAVETQELYGYISMATREWKGAFYSPRVMRNIGAIPR